MTGSGQMRDDTICRRFCISGRVQGVFFRDSTCREALRLQITGYARNMPDGTVEVVAEGMPGNVEELVAWLRKGPPMASVSSVTEMSAPDGENFQAFSTN